MSLSLPEFTAWCNEFLGSIDAHNPDSKIIKKVGSLIGEILSGSNVNPEKFEYFINDFTPKLIDKIILYRIASYEDPPPFYMILIPLSKLFVNVFSVERLKFLETMMKVFENKHIAYFTFRYFTVLGNPQSNLEYYVKCLNVFKSEEFKTLVQNLCGGKIDLNLANILLRILQIAKRYTHIFPDVSYIEPIIPSFICTCQNLQNDQIRALDEAKFKNDLEILLKVSNSNDLILPLLSISVSIYNNLFASGYLSKQYSALSFINETLDQHNLYANKLCEILHDTSFIETNMNSIHHSLVDQFCKLMSTMLKYSYVKNEHILNFCKISFGENQSVQNNFFKAINSVICSLKPLNLQDFLVSFANLENIPENALFILIDQASYAQLSTKQKIFDLYMDKYSKGDKRRIIIDVICKYAPQNNQNVFKLCVDNLNNKTDLELTLPLLQSTINSLDQNFAKQIFDSIIYSITQNDAVQYITLISKTTYALQTVDDQEFKQLLFLMKEILNDDKYPQVSDIFKYLVANRKIDRGSVQLLMETISDYEQMNPKIFDLFYSAFESINTQLSVFRYSSHATVDIEDLDCIDIFWKTLFNTGNSKFVKFVLKLSKTESQLQYTLNKLIENMDKNGALRCLYQICSKYINYLEHSSRFIPQSQLYNITFTGMINETVQFPSYCYIKDIKKYLKRKLNTKTISLRANNEYLEKTQLIYNNERIEVSGFFGKPANISFDVSSLMMANFDKLINALKNPETSCSALKLLLILDAPHKPDINFNEFVNEDYFIYCLNIAAKSSSKINGLIGYAFSNQISEDYLKFTLQVILHLSIQQRLGYSPDDLNLMTEKAVSSKGKFIDLYISIIQNFISNGLTLSNDDLWNLTVLTLFDPRYEVRLTISSLLNGIPEKVKLLTKLLPQSDNNYCKEYFNLLIPCCHENREEIYNISKQLLFEKYSIPKTESVLCQIAFKTPSLEFSRNFFQLFERLIYLEFPSDMQNIVDFILREIIFNGLVYYEPNLSLFQIIIVSIDKIPEVGTTVMKYLSSINEKFIGSTPCPPDPSGLRGLKNLGATCYMNSTLQQLCQINEFTDTFFSAKFQSKTWQEAFQYVLMKMKFFPEKAINPISYINLWTDWGDEKINPSVQQDASEYLSMLFTRIEDVEGALQLFRGKIVSKFVTMDDEFVAEREEPIESLQFEVKNHANMSESINTFLQPSIFNGKNKYSTENGKIDAKCYHFIKEAPKYLIVQLKRFEYNVEKQIREKINTYYKIDEVLDIGPMTVSKQEMLYDLIGVQVHLGTSDSGHYYSYIKKKNQWYCLNDESVTKFKGDIVNEVAGGETVFEYFDDRTQTYRKGTVPKTSNAYILWYKKRDAPKGDEKEINQELIDKLIKDIRSFLLRGIVRSQEFLNLAKSAARFDTEGIFLVNYTMNFIEIGQDPQDLCDLCLNAAGQKLVADKIVLILPTYLLTGNQKTRKFLLKLYEKAIVNASKEPLQANVKELLRKPEEVLNNYMNFAEFFTLTYKIVDDEIQQLLSQFINKDIPAYANTNKRFYENADLSTIIMMIRQVPPIEIFMKLVSNFTNTQALTVLIPQLNYPKEMWKKELSKASSQQLAGLFMLFQFDTTRPAIYKYVIHAITENPKMREAFAEKLLNGLKLIDADLSATFDLNNLHKLLLIHPWYSVRSLHKEIVYKIIDIKSGDESIMRLITSLVEKIDDACKQSCEVALSYSVSQQGAQDMTCFNEFISLIQNILLNTSVATFLIPIADLIVNAMSTLRNAPNYPNQNQLSILNMLHATIYPILLERFWANTSYSKFVGSMSVFTTFNKDKKLFKKVFDLTPQSEVRSLYKSSLFNEIASIGLNEDVRDFAIAHPAEISLVTSIIFDQARYEVYMRGKRVCFYEITNFALMNDQKSVELFESMGTFTRAWTMLTSHKDYDRAQIMVHLANFNNAYTRIFNGQKSLFLIVLTDRLLSNYKSVGFSVENLFKLYDSNNYDALRAWYDLVSSFLYFPELQKSIFERIVSHHTPVSNCKEAANLVVKLFTSMSSKYKDLTCAILIQELNQVSDEETLDILVDFAEHQDFFSSEKGLNVLKHICTSRTITEIIQRSFVLHFPQFDQETVAAYRKNCINQIIYQSNNKVEFLINSLVSTSLPKPIQGQPLDNLKELSSYLRERDMNAYADKIDQLIRSETSV